MECNNNLIMRTWLCKSLDKAAKTTSTINKFNQLVLPLATLEETHKVEDYSEQLQVSEVKEVVAYLVVVNNRTSHLELHQDLGSQQDSEEPILHLSEVNQQAVDSLAVVNNKQVHLGLNHSVRLLEEDYLAKLINKQHHLDKPNKLRSVEQVEEDSLVNNNNQLEVAYSDNSNNNQVEVSLDNKHKHKVVVYSANLINNRIL